jgi:hypothetical protein
MKMSTLRCHRLARFWRWALYSCLSLSVAALLGYYSSVLSQEACERAVVKKLAVEVMEGKPFYTKESECSPQILRLLNSESVYYLPVGGDEASHKRLYPTGYVKGSKVRCPFIVSTEWGWQIAPLYGAGTRQYYVCLFGLVFEVGEVAMWSS